MTDYSDTPSGNQHYPARAVMAANRELRRVPADFDWPLGKVWKGYIVPDELVPPTCPDCEGGYSVQCAQIMRTYYPHQVREPVSAWHDKLTQDDVDMLIADGRFPEGSTAAEANAAAREGASLFGKFSMDAINIWLVAKRRCVAIGAPTECPTCDGTGNVGTAEQRKAYDEWEGEDQPEGDHLQVWETTSEGSPITPVFPPTEDGRRALVEYLVANAGGFTEGLTSEDWDRCLESSWPAFDLATGRVVT